MNWFFKKFKIYYKMEILLSFTPNNIIFNILILMIEFIELLFLIIFKNSNQTNLDYLFFNLKILNDEIFEIIILSSIDFILLVIIFLFLFMKIKKEKNNFATFWFKLISVIFFLCNTILLLPFINIIYKLFFFNTNTILICLNVLFLFIILIINYIFLTFFNQISLYKNSYFNFIDSKYFYYEIIFKYLLMLTYNFTQNFYLNILVSFFNFFLVIDFNNNIICLNLKNEKYFFIKKLYLFIFPLLFWLKSFYNEDSNFWIIYSIFLLFMLIFLSNYLLKQKYIYIWKYNKSYLTESENLKNYIILCYNIINHKNFNYLVFDLEYSFYYWNKKYFKNINENNLFKFNKDILEYNNFLIKFIEKMNEELNDIKLSIIYFQLLFKFKKTIWKIIIKIEELKKNNLITTSLDFYLNKQINTLEVYFKKNKKGTINYINLNIILDFENKTKNFIENISLFLFNYNLILYELSEVTIDCNKILNISKKMISTFKKIKKEYTTFESFEELKLKIDYIYIKFLFIILNKEKDGKVLLNKFIDNAIKNHQSNKIFKKNLNIETIELNEVVSDDNKFNIIISSLKTNKIVNLDNNIKKYLNFDKSDVINQSLDTLIPKYLKKFHNEKIDEFIESSNIDIFHNKNNFYFVNNNKFYVKACKIKTKILNNLNEDILIYNFLNYSFDTKEYIIFDMNSYSILGITYEAKKWINLKSKFTYNSPNLENRYKLNNIFDDLFEKLKDEKLKLNKIYTTNYLIENINKIIKLNIELAGVEKIDKGDVGIIKINDYTLEKDFEKQNSIKNSNILKNTNKIENNNFDNTKNSKNSSADKNNIYENKKTRKFKNLSFLIIIYFIFIIIFLIILSIYTINLDLKIKKSVFDLVLIDNNAFYVTEIVYLTRKILLIKNNLTNDDLNENIAIFTNYTNLIQENKNLLLEISNKYFENKNIKVENFISNEIVSSEIDYFESLNSIISDSFKLINFFKTYDFKNIKINEIQNNELKKILYNVLYNGNGPITKKLIELSNSFYKIEIINLNGIHYIIDIIQISWIFLGVSYFLIIFYFFRLIKIYIKKNMQLFSFFNKEEIRFINELLNNFKLKYLSSNIKDKEINKLFNTNVSQTPVLNFTKFMKTSKLKNNLYSYKNSIMKNIKNNKDKGLLEKIKFFNNYNYDVNFFKNIFLFNFKNLIFLSLCFVLIFYSNINYFNYRYSFDYFKNFSLINVIINYNYNLLLDSIILKKQNPEIKNNLSIFNEDIKKILGDKNNLYKLSSNSFITNLNILKNGNLCNFIDYKYCKNYIYKNKSYFLSIEYYINNLLDLDILNTDIKTIFYSNLLIFNDNLVNVINRINIKLLKYIVIDLNKYYDIKLILFIIYNIFISFLLFYWILIKGLKLFKNNLENLYEIEDLISIIPINIRENNDLLNLYNLENKNIKIVLKTLTQ